MLRWNVGKHHDIANEMEENNLDVMAVTQTNLRGNIDEISGNFRFIGKGWEHIGI